jgi:hypothetical protein
MVARDDASPIRRVFFPLRSAVELFSDPRSPDAVTKAKEAAILFDEVIFEDGLLDVSITPNGSTSFWNPPATMTADLLERSRRVNAEGAPMTLAIGKQSGPDIPAEDLRVFLEGRVSKAYLAEFHTGILEELAPLAPDWVRTVGFGGQKQPGWMGDPVYEAIRRLNFADFTDKELMPEVEPFLRSFVYESFNRDATVAAALGSWFTSTPLFAPMIARVGAETDLAGNEALGIIVGNVGALPWEAVFEFREHHGCVEARDRLREFEHLAVESEPRDAYDFLRKVSQEVNRGFRAAVEDLAPKLPEEIGKQVLLLGVSMASVIGAPIAVLAEGASNISASRAFSRSWVSAVMTLTSS